MNPISHDENIDSLSVPDYTSRDPYNKILDEELKIFRMTLIREKILSGDQAPQMADFRQYLLEERKITTIEGTDERGNIRKLTEDDVDYPACEVF